MSSSGNCRENKSIYNFTFSHRENGANQRELNDRFVKGPREGDPCIFVDDHVRQTHLIGERKKTMKICVRKRTREGKKKINI